MLLSHELVQAVLDDWHTASISTQLRAMLGFLEKLTLTPGEVGPSDAAPLREVGISDKAVEDAIAVCTCFNIIDRLADSLNFAVPTPEQFAHTANAPQTHSYILL